MKIIHMPSVILFIPDSMLPKPPLPDTSLATFSANGTAAFIRRDGMYKTNLDGFPAIGIIRIANGQDPQAMKVIGQYHPAIDMKGPLATCSPYRPSQRRDMPYQKIRTPLQEVYREEIGATGYATTSIIGHRNLPLLVDDYRPPDEAEPLARSALRGLHTRKPIH